jgi:hypothetical protein
MSEKFQSLRRRQAADVLKRARRLPVGPDRNDLRQLAISLLALDRRHTHDRSALPVHAAHRSGRDHMAAWSNHNV